MNIHFSPMPKGTSAISAVVTPEAAPDSADAFLQLVGVDPSTSPPLVALDPLQEGVDVDATLPAEEDGVAAAETATEPQPAFLVSAEQTFAQLVVLPLPAGGNPVASPATAPPLQGDVAAQSLVPLAATDHIKQPAPDTVNQTARDGRLQLPMPAADGSGLVANAMAQDDTTAIRQTANTERPPAWLPQFNAAVTEKNVQASVPGSTTPQVAPQPVASATSQPSLIAPNPTLVVAATQSVRASGPDQKSAQALQDGAGLTLPASEIAAEPSLLTTPALPAQASVGLRMTMPETAANGDAPAEVAASPDRDSTTEQQPDTINLAANTADAGLLPPPDLAILPEGELPSAQLPQEGALSAIQLQSLSNSTSGPADRNADIPTVRFADLSATITRTASADGAQTTTLQLDPVELGTVAFSMDTGPSGLIVTIVAERPETLDLLRRHADQFLGDLRQSGFQGASLQFGQSGTGQGGFGQSPQQDQPPHRYGNGMGDHPLATPPAFETPSQTRRQNTGQGLNLRL